MGSRFNIGASFLGALAQLVERNNGIVEAIGSNPIRSNIYVYNDEGASPESLIHALHYFKQHSRHSVQTIDAATIKAGAWTQDAALLVMPGGADLPYVRKLRGNANQIIKDYVQNGGSYLGICAGSYYGSSYVAFDPGGPLEVVGKRELGFFEGKAIGPVFGPFDYHSKSGARAALIRTKEATSYFYFNGGPYFENAESYTNTTVLGWYEGDLPAIIHVRYGKGNVILSGVHFEFDPHQVTDEETYPTDVLNKLKISISSLNHQKY